MKLLDICLFNFRCYEQARFQFHPEFTVFIGDNGKGKTTILDAAAIMLGTYFQGSGIKTGQSVIRKSDARFFTIEKGGQVFLERLKKVYLTARVHCMASHRTPSSHHQPINEANKLIEWRRDIGDRGAKAKQFVEFGKRQRDAINIGESVDLPLFLYYGSGRLWNIAHDRKTAQLGSQLTAYHFCLDPKSDQKAFEKWFRQLTFAALQKGVESPALHVIEQTVLTCIPNVQKVYHDVAEDQIMLQINANILIPFDSLSDGYRNMVAMVANIAYRAVCLNPHLEIEAAQQTRGIVLIDEIDLHLHLTWQRQVVGHLRQAFPQLQFIATTHSPFIIQSLNPGEVIDLNQPTNSEMVESMSQDIAIPGPESEYSHRSIEDIAEGVMGVNVPQRSQRYQDMYDAAQDYYRVLQNAESADAEQKEAIKQRLDELSAPFSDNVAYHAFLEMERLAAGLGASVHEEIEQ